MAGCQAAHSHPATPHEEPPAPVPMSDAAALEHSPHGADLLRRVVCAECLRCEPSERMAIAHVARNRALSPGWWGGTLAEVLTRRGQFATADSPWCRPLLPPPPPRADGRGHWSPSMVAAHQRARDEIRAEVDGVLAGDIEDHTAGAVYFHARRLGTVWRHLTEVPVPGTWRHRFFR